MMRRISPNSSRLWRSYRSPTACLIARDDALDQRDVAGGVFLVLHVSTAASFLQRVGDLVACSAG